MIGRIGQEEQDAALIDALASGRMAHAWLLSGPRGVGKALFAAAAAAFIIADGDRRAREGSETLDLPESTPALDLIRAGTHSEYHLLTREPPKAKKKGEAPGEGDLARNITIDQVRQLLMRLRTRPALSRWRTVIIDSIDDCERGAANALLKTLEEPPEATIFLLVSHNPGRLLPTIRSRCRSLRFAPLDDDQVRAAIGAARPDVSGRALDDLVAMAHGAPGQALRHADLKLGDIMEALDTLASRGDSGNRTRVALAQSLSGVANRERLDLMLALAADRAHRAAMTSDPAVIDVALTARERLLDLRRTAIAASEDPASVALIAAGIVAMLAPGAGAVAGSRGA